jgi:serine phosphatase RsbU (regulator of sigma subunit)
MDFFDAETYAQAERDLRTALASGEGMSEAVAFWRRVSSAAILELDELQSAMFRVTQDRTSEVALHARRSTYAWGLILCISAGIVFLAAKVIVAWVVLPLERMRDAMLKLAVDDFSVALPKQSKLTEVDAMEDALRVFKANGMRRQSLQSERLQLHGRLEETYRHLKTDLEAAAVIQASLLPQQAQLGGVALTSYFRPSNFLAGDTFDVLQQPDGRVIVFQIDVAGHGAAAALVSVASKYTVAQAILQRRPGTDLAALTQEINREWPSDLPYFTLLIAEIDPVAGKGTLVQAGHPSPMLLRQSGELVALGDGGLPVGVLANATYDAILFSFGPNDRLLIATDGMHEMANQGGELFSEERVQDLIRNSAGQTTEEILTTLDTALRAWRGNETLDDDVTIVMLEGKRASEHQRGNERRFDHPEAGRSAA